MIILSNSLMLNPGALLTLPFEKMLYDNLRKIGKEGFISPEIFIYFFIKGGESSSQFRWFTIAKFKL